MRYCGWRVRPMLRRRLRAALCPAGDFCSSTKPSRGLSQGLCWRCPDCGRIWTCRFEFGSVPWRPPVGWWRWRPAPWRVRLLVRLDRVTWAEEVGAQ